jgi:signal transduction histidine kinase
MGQTIAVGLARSADGHSARLWVADEGPGIPESERRHIWEPFHRLERDANSAIAGSGIGLALVRNLTTAHGGRVFVEEGEHGGSRFVVEIPCIQRQRERVAEPVAAPADVGTFAGAPRSLVTRQ